MERSHILNMLYAFSLGFFSIRLSVALGLLLIIDTIFRMKVGKPSGRLIFSTTLLIIFVVLFYFIGWSNLPEGSLIERFVFIIFTLFAASLLSIRIKDDELVAVLSAFVYGMLIYSIPIVFFSLLKGGYGYGSLYNPWTLMEMNSPSVSNDFALVSAFLILFGLERWRLTSAILLIVVFFCGVYVGGRTFLLIYILSLFLFVFSSVNSKRILILAPIFILFATIFFVSGFDKVVFSRFYEMGLESARFDMLIQAFDDIPRYPYGGFEPDVYSYKGEWFHNFYLDTASTSGWYPLFISLFMSFYILIFVYRYHHKRFFYLFLIVILIMSQDVIMEANLKPFLFFIILSSLLFRRNLKENSLWSHVK